MIKKIWNFIGFPLRAFMLNEPWQEKVGLCTLKQERMQAVRPWLKGQVLDIGCGENTLIRNYRKEGEKGVGVDVTPFKGVDLVTDTTQLPFQDEEFNTVVMVACLNHIFKNKRKALLLEAHRVLTPEGRLVLTMINHVIGYFCHKLAWWDKFPFEGGGITAEEDYGLSAKEVIATVTAAGFVFERSESFLYKMNRVYCFRKKG